ncbi:MAG TPA: hypothetical protein VGI75_03860, partial [Pirellulales bacterium]
MIQLNEGNVFTMRHTILAARSAALRIATFSFAAFCGLTFSAVAQATLLPVGAAIPSSGVPGLAGGGILVANTGALPFVSPTFTGTLQSEAFLNDPANPFGPGNITFTYLITNTNGPDSIDRFTVNGYGVPGLVTDASYQAPTAGVLPASFDRSVAATLGDVIGVSYVDAPLGFGTLLPGSASALVVVHTNSPLFGLSTAAVIDSTTTSVAALAPLATVPEPSTIVLGLIGLAG